MKSLEFEKYGTSELNFDKQIETDGGNPFWVAYGVLLAGYFLTESAANPSSSVKHLEDGYNAGRH